MSRTHGPPTSSVPGPPPGAPECLFAVLGATVCLGIAGTGIAFGYWNSTDSSNPAHALANTLPQGATPSATVTPANSNTVVITFAEVATASGAVEIPAADYILNSYPAGGSSPTTVTGSCSGTGTITCIVSSVPDGSWQYTDTPTYATNWVGIESAKSGVVTVSLAPTVAITYPVNGTEYGADWTGTITGTASGASGTTISGVQVAIEDTKTGEWWDGTSFSATTQTFVPVTSGTTTWFLTFAASDLTPGDSYSVVAQATDSEGNVGTSSTVSFSYCVQHASACGRHHLPGEQHHLRGRLDRDDHGHRFAGDRGDHQLHRAGHRGHHHRPVVERHFLQRHKPDLRARQRHDDLVPGLCNDESHLG